MPKNSAEKQLGHNGNAFRYQKLAFNQAYLMDGDGGNFMSKMVSFVSYGQRYLFACTHAMKYLTDAVIQ